MFSSTKLHLILVAHCLIFSNNQPFRLGWGMHMAGEGGSKGGEGGCTCILCFPPGYAPVSTNKFFWTGYNGTGCNSKANFSHN